MEFKKQVTISEAAFIEYQVVAPDHSLWRKIIGTIIIIAGVGIYIGRETNLVNSIYSIIGVSALYVVLVTFVNKATARLLAKRNYKKHNVANLKINFSIKPEMIQLSLDEKVADYKWAKIKDVVNSPIAFYFYSLTNAAIILDKNNLNNQEIELIESLIVKYKDPATKLKLLTTKKI